jgi:hypothetical protein
MSFKHIPLSSPDSIRLVVIHPGHPDEEITCSIAEHPFYRRPVYQALSYMWGDADHEEIIKLNGKPFMVRRNLWSFLWHERSKEYLVLPPKYESLPSISDFWIDAICIDQSNIPERNDPVPKDEPDL